MHTIQATGFALALAAMLTVSTAVAQPQAEQRFLIRASDLIGYRVENPRGEQIGTITDLAVYPNEQRLGYVVIGQGGFLGMGRNLYAVSLDQLELNPVTEIAILDMTEEQFLQQQIDRRAWPMEVEPNGARPDERPGAQPDDNDWDDDWQNDNW